MTLSWFPGHMNKAKREISKAMGKVRLVIELVDARAPFATSNPLIPGMRGDTPTITILNKCDLADPKVTDLWVKKLEEQPGVRAIPLQREMVSEAKGLLNVGRQMLPEDRNRDVLIQAMILGIPNVGKSTLINTLAGRTLAKTANKPAVTRQQQRVKVGRDFVLIDTPGFLWPRLEPMDAAMRLAATGAIADARLDLEEVAVHLLTSLMELYPQQVMSRYKLDTMADEPTEVLEQIARKRGALRKGGVVDMAKVCDLLVFEFRQGKIGRVSLERP
ncbi:MAG: ribosome biogenesis GTPase YlqF [Myxococcota bacterium]